MRTSLFRHAAIAGRVLDTYWENLRPASRAVRIPAPVVCRQGSTGLAWYPRDEADADYLPLLPAQAEIAARIQALDPTAPPSPAEANTRPPQ